MRGVVVNYSQKGAGAPRELFIFSKNGVGAVFRAGCFSGFVLNMIHLPGCALMAKNGQGTFFQNIDAMH